jgi:hypothetical protein
MDLQAIGKPSSCHEGRLFGKGARGHTTFNIDYVTYTQEHFIVLQQSILVAPYVRMHVQMLRSSNPKKFECWIAREHETILVVGYVFKLRIKMQVFNWLTRTLMT